MDAGPIRIPPIRSGRRWNLQAWHGAALALEAWHAGDLQGYDRIAATVHAQLRAAAIARAIFHKRAIPGVRVNFAR